MRSQATLILTLVSSVAAFWRMPCRSRTGLGRLDPLMDPGEISDHVHTIHGGGGFGFNADYETLNSSDCTSCEVTQDKSAYWTPPPYFVYSNGTAVMVPQVGGMLAYYLMYLDNVTAFPEGFQMLAGNKYVRNFTGPFPDTPLSDWSTNSTDDQFFLEQRAIGFNCLNYAKAPEGSLYRHTFPTKEYMDANCLDGLRLELAFPSCNNGSIDSSDHKSHMKYPSLVKEGECPSGYDVHLPFMFFETIWATNEFAGEDGEFVLSFGDPVGTGYHGDFIMGWESEDFLQSAINTCTNLSGEIQDCALFDIQTDAVAAECTFPMPEDLKNDNPAGPRSGLPVAVPIQSGPAQATNYPVAGRSDVPTSSLPSTTATASYSLPTLSYSAANPSITSTAQGGIVVNAASSGDRGQIMPAASKVESAVSSSTIAASSSLITAAPAADSATGSEPDIIATSYMTSGNEVIEMVVEQVDVTVTATPSAGAKHKRHLHKHLHHPDARR